MTSRPDLVDLVMRRAGERCEYCRMHQSLQGATFHVEHITPRSKQGLSEADNLALACPGCNLHKSDRIHALDLESGTTTPLFHPRTQVWSDHFRWEGYSLQALTPIGRVTLDGLQLNSPRRVRIRQAEELFGLFPG